MSTVVSNLEMMARTRRMELDRELHAVAAAGAARASRRRPSGRLGAWLRRAATLAGRPSKNS